MPSVAKHRKIKRPGVVIKRTQCPRNRPPKVRTPSYEKLKTNNHSLARALSQEKQESQSLFSQNVALIAEVHELGFACKRRDDVILNIMKNSKEMLNMMVTMTKYLTNTISSCQEFTSNPGNSFRSSASSTGKRDSTRRLSGKSPARGVVKPMVSGHTITKPTINLSRVNMQNIQNVLSLTTIEEAPSSPEMNSGSPSSNSSRSPSIRVSDAASRRQLNYENRRVCRMSERIPVVLIDDLDDRRLSNRSRISERFSGRFSKRKSGNASETRLKRRSSDQQTDRFEFSQIKSPRVALSDVSKLLQNSQTVNVRTLEENSLIMDDTRCVNSTIVSRSSEDCSLRSNKEVVFQLSDSDSDSEICKTIPTKPASTGNKNINDSRKQKSDLSEKTRILNESSSFEKSNLDKTIDINGGSLKLSDDSKKQNSTTNHVNEDPLEGPSWLFNNTTTLLDDNSSDSETFSTIRSKEQTYQNIAPFTPDRTSTKLSDELQTPRKESQKKNDSSRSSDEDSFPNAEMAINLTRFVTKHRGNSAIKEMDQFNDIDDPTIMLNIRQQTEKHEFNIDDLQLPVIDSPVITRPVIEPEITNTINIGAINEHKREQHNFFPNLSVPRISDFPILEDILEDDLQNDNSPVLEKPKAQRKRKQKNYSELSSDNEQVSNSSPSLVKKKKVKHKSNLKSKDPSAAKVVLQKLPSKDTKALEETSQARNLATIQEPSSDSESSNASSKYTSSRPRRQKAPVNLQEPSLGKKLRRQD